jgi:hypothetical protein
VPAQVFTPVLVATHNSSAAFFTVGAAASAELQTLAETGNVMDVQDSGGLHGPGNTGGVVVTGSDTFNWVSLAAMLIPTNDAFVSARTTLPAAGEVKVLYAYAYDAGTEVTNAWRPSSSTIDSARPGPAVTCSRERSPVRLTSTP